jgi:hypothetical protein
MVHENCLNPVEPRDRFPSTFFRSGERNLSHQSDQYHVPQGGRKPSILLDNEIKGLVKRCRSFDQEVTRVGGHGKAGSDHFPRYRRWFNLPPAQKKVMLKKIKVENAVGLKLAHDHTQILPGKFKPKTSRLWATAACACGARSDDIRFAPSGKAADQ